MLAIGDATLLRMRTRRALLGGFFTAVATSAAFLQCVGDSVVPPPGSDSGADTGTTDGGKLDGASDAPVPEAGPPAPDGSLAWVQHFNSNVGLTEVAVRESGNVSFVVVGGYRNSASGNDATTHIGSFDLPKGADTTLPLIAGLDGQGNPTWVNVPPSTPSGGLGGDVFLGSVVTDAAGDIYVAGTSSRATVTLAQPHSGPIAFISKLTGDGKTFLWDHPITNPDYIGAPHLAVSGKQVVVAFTYTKTITYDVSKSFTSSGAGDVAVLSLDPANGATRWATTFGASTGAESASGVALDPNGDAYVVGQGNGTINGTGAGFPLAANNTGGYDAILVKLAFADGKAIFTKNWATSGSQQSNALGVDTRGSAVAVAGQFSGAVDFGKGVVGATGGTDGFVLVFDGATKATAFVATAGGTDFDGFQSIGFDAWGQVLATGQSASVDAKIGTKALKPATFRASSLLAAKWDASGALLWANSVVPTLANGNPPYSSPDATAPYLGIYPGGVRVSKGGFLVSTGALVGGANFGDGIYRPRLSGMGQEGIAFCFQPPCPPTLAPDGLVNAWSP